MPKGPKGVRRPADTNAAAVMVGRIATGEITDPLPKPAKAAAGVKGGKARARALTPEKRREIAQKAARARKA